MSVRINLDALDKMTSKAERTKRQTEYAMRAASVMRKYVPRDENLLRASEPLNSKYAKGILVWNTPYARTQYEVPMMHTEAGTTDHWDEACWKREGDGLIAYVEAMYGRY